MKCDQTKPACNKCTRAKRVCPGYREPFEVNFKDQTDLVIRKHERTNSTSRGVLHKPRKGHGTYVAPFISAVSLTNIGYRSDLSSSEDSVISTSSLVSEEPTKVSPNCTWYPSPGDLPRFNTPVADQALCYFVANYVCIRSHTPGAGLQFLWPLVKSAMQNDTFNTAFEAVCMASIASRPNSGALVPLARVYYDRALKQVARTVQDRERAKEDQSLAAIIMLILYEVYLLIPHDHIF